MDVATCQCGCGEIVPIATKTDRRAGWVKGEPLRYIRGHATRGKKLPDTSGKRSLAATGRRHSSETKKKLSVLNRGEGNPMHGKHHTEATRMSMSEARRGAGNPRWNGGSSTERQRWQRSAEAQEWRIAVFERDDFTCQGCGIRGGDLHAHHLKAWATHPELRCVVANGQTLCIPCHRLTDSYGRLAA